ncbi:hypothetical protein D2Q93_06795 [Alicyclobacillaceae bacterium I2511]|nr:hypothetical protein D2Q93_06795 [Alicyclobacillaceae bacterium I2511]
MSHRLALPEIGRIVEALQGRDRGLVFVVVGRDGDRFLWLADGHRRPLEKPKRKNTLHVRMTSGFAQQFAALWEQSGKVSNALLRHAIHQYMLAQGEAQEASEEGGR